MKRDDKKRSSRAKPDPELRKKTRELRAGCTERVEGLEAANASLRQELEEREHAEKTRPGAGKSVSSFKDVTERVKTEQEIQRVVKAVQDTSDCIFITDRNGVIEYVNHAVEEMTGFSREELIGKKPGIFKSEKHAEAFYKELWDTVLSGATYRNIMTNRRKNGELFDVYHTITPLKDEAGEVTHFVAISKDLTLQQLLKERVNYLAYYDGLTALPNMALLLDRIKQEVPRNEYRKRHLAVLVVDIDRFTFINEMFGSGNGDEVLREVGRRLSAIVREGDTVARLGRDHFGILLTDVAQSQDIVFVANKIFSALEHPLRIAGTEITLAAYIGISVSPQDALDAAALVKNAEIALSKSKKRGLNTYQFFTTDMDRQATNFAAHQKSLFCALNNNEFVLHYQPYFNVISEKLAGIECLIRWNSPEYGFIHPSSFIPALEDTRMIINVGKWVVKETCRQIRAWEDKGYAMVPVTTNLSAVQFKQPDMGDFLETTIKESGIDPRNLAFELTESTIMQNPDMIKVLLTRLKKMGISISTDDFGTGYSSLSYLKNLPLDNLKIDISFIRDITNNDDDGAIVSSIVAMARNLRLKTIAEGVETAEQLKILRMLKCDMAQGYYFCKPSPAAAVEALLARRE